TLGYIGALHPHLEDSYEVKGVGVFEINFETLVGLAARWKTFQPFSNYPELYEDFSFTLEEKHPLGELLGRIRKVSELVERVEIADRYSEKGKRSFTVRVTFQSDEKGLSMEEIKPIREKIQTLVRKGGGNIRD
ncbi:MAG: hypothetical protein Q8P12_06725, partial [bacterium]|nr:hypothetical protein [bacterium]